MMKDKKQWWGIKDPDGDIVITDATRAACWRMLFLWVQIFADRLYSDTHPIDPADRRWAGKSWPQLRRMGWSCVKVWVYQEPMVDKYFKTQYNELLEMTRSLDEHPEDYNGPCECKTCMSYAD